MKLYDPSKMSGTDGICTACSFNNWEDVEICEMCGAPMTQNSNGDYSGACGFAWEHHVQNDYIGSSVWQCEGCTLLNDVEDKYCAACYASRTQFSNVNRYNASDDTESELLGWECDECTYFNYGEDKYCQECAEMRQDDTPFTTYSAQYGTLHRSTIDEGCVKTLSSPLANMDQTAERRLLLIGKTGSGKSATGNCILNETVFHSAASGQSITNKCQLAQAERFGRQITVVDTPGLFDTKSTNDSVTTEIVKCTEMILPGPHAVLLVVRAGRFTKEEQDTVRHFADHFGENVFRFMVIIFTGKDELDSEDTSVEEFVATAPQELQDTLRKCGMRYVAFNNRLNNRSPDSQVQELMLQINHMLEANGSHFYTNDMLEEADRNVRRRLAKQIELQKKKNRQETERLKREERKRHRKQLAREVVEKDRLYCLKLEGEWEKKDRDQTRICLEREKRKIKKQLDEVKRQLDE